MHLVGLDLNWFLAPLECGQHNVNIDMQKKNLEDANDGFCLFKIYLKYELLKTKIKKSSSKFLRTFSRMDLRLI